MVTKRPRGIVPRNDGDPHKRFPNGLRATIKSIRKYWPRGVYSGPGRSTLKFAGKFSETYNEVMSRYGQKPTSEGALVRVINKLEGSGDQERSDITFAKMRAFAAFVGIPTGLLLVFSQLVSYEAQGRSREDMLAFVAACRAAINALEGYANGLDSASKGFHGKVKDGAGYHARLEGLLTMVDAYEGKSVVPASLKSGI
jgi:hypothetical protein